MNVHVSYRLSKTPFIEKDVQHQIEKLRKRLQVFRPELIHLKGLVEENSPREGASVSLNLRLPPVKTNKVDIQIKTGPREPLFRRQ